MSLAIARSIGGGEPQPSAKPKHAQQFEFDKRAKRTTILVLAIPQLIAFALVFPGIVGYDSGYHILQFIDDSTPITSRYSVVYTLLLGGCYRFGQILGSAIFGFALAMAIQVFVSVVALYAAIAYVVRFTRSKAMFWLALCISALHPFSVLLRVSACQDVLFGAFFVLASMELLKLGTAFHKGQTPKLADLTSLAVFSLLMMLMRNNGSYAIIVMLVLSIPFLIRYKAWKIAASLLIALVCFYAVQGPVYSACGVQKSSVTLREMSSIPSQQLTRALAEHPEGFTSEELATYINSYDSGEFGYEANDASWYWSQSELSDVAKSRMDQDYVKNNLGEYLGLYTSMGLKCPDSYTNAFLMNTLGYWYPLKSYPDSRMYHPLIEGGNTCVNLYKYLRDFAEAGNSATHQLISDAMSKAYWSDTPILSLVLKPGFYLLLFVASALAAFVARRYEYLPIITLCAGLVVTLLLSPVCLFRYVYPLVLATPLLLSVFSKRHTISR